MSLGVRRVRQRLLSTFFIKELRFRPESVQQEALLPALSDADPWVRSSALRSCLELGVLGPRARAAMLHA